MRIAIHQPHYFPWLGYLEKMARVDLFVILDEVQFEKGSYMNRNRVLDLCGNVQYLTITTDANGYLSLPYKQLKTKNDDEWKKKQCNALRNYYKKSPFADEMNGIFQTFLLQSLQTTCGWTCSSIQFIREAFNIQTPIVFQSELKYDRTNKRSDLVFSICEELRATQYYSGKGASAKYLDIEKFKNAGIGVIFQDYEHPIYKQNGNNSFIPGLSVLDLLYSCGIENSKNIFWNSVNAEGK